MQYKSSFFLFILKILGFFWCEWDSCIPTLIAKNTRFFLFYQTHLEGSHSYDTPTDCLSYRPQQASMSPYSLFGKLLFSHFHTEPLTGKSFKKTIIIFQTINIYIMVFAKTHHFFYFFLIFLIFFFRMWTFKPKVYDFTKWC